MAITFFVGDHVTIDVGDPGYGYLEVCFNTEDEYRWGKNHECTLRGRKMWQALESLTELACRGVDEPLFGAVDGLWPMNVGLARMMLPQFQTAMLYAAGGSDRAERLTQDDEASHVLCVRCNEGTVYSSHRTMSDDCQQYGHQPFGYAGNWEQAQEAAARDRKWAEIHQLNAEGMAR